MEQIDEIRKIIIKGNIKMSEDELSNNVVIIEHLIDLWLDCFEKEIFDGKTLQELLSTKII